MKKSNIQTQRNSWTTEQDCFLIEHNALSMQQLRQHLPYSEVDIQNRKKILGLNQRDRQMRKFL